MKPICCGDRRDAEQLLAASSEGLSIDEVNPLWLKTPAAPFAASLIEGGQIDSAPFIARLRDLQKRFEFVVVEGVGGWLVPIRRDYFVSDLAVEMQLPVVVVAMNRLGCLNHAMLTIRGIAAAGLPCLGVALNSVDGTADIASTTNAEILQKITDVPILRGLAETMAKLPPEWRVITRQANEASASRD